jgi:hypothetical protein
MKTVTGSEWKDKNVLFTEGVDYGGHAVTNRPKPKAKVRKMLYDKGGAFSKYSKDNDYVFPQDLLPNLSAFLKYNGVDMFYIKSERQALMFAVQLTHAHVTWPKKGQPCFPLLQQIERGLKKGTLPKK